MISNQQVKDICSDWGLSGGSVELGMTREVTLPERLHPDLALIIQGVRRCGKSTLMTQLPKRYGLPLADCYYCNFEDPRLLGALDHTLLTQIVSVARDASSDERHCYFFFDEIQNVQGWEKWLHSQLERPKNNYFTLTGSNAALLSGEFGTSLTGRHRTIELFPFSWPEYQRLFPKKNLEDYLLDGGFPRALTIDQPKTLLQEYFQDIILRDVMQRSHSRSALGIQQVVKMTFDSCGSELSYRKIAAIAGLGVDTVKHYLEACEQAYLLFACPYFAFSEKKRLVRHKKYYAIDPAMRYAITGTHGRDFGKSLELLVYLRLRQTHEQVFYWQEAGKGEVDFVTLEGQTITPYQVTWENPEPRHHQALNAFYESFPHAEEAIWVTSENATAFLTDYHLPN